uniref:Uncharacterized protein n=1 Tax=Glossina austeni TaxID=7395 RepID=A0A1A9UMB2_GLOAU
MNEDATERWRKFGSLIYVYWANLFIVQLTQHPQHRSHRAEFAYNDTYTTLSVFKINAKINKTDWNRIAASNIILDGEILYAQYFRFVLHIRGNMARYRPHPYISTAENNCGQFTGPSIGASANSHIWEMQRDHLQLRSSIRQPAAAGGFTVFVVLRNLTKHFV